MGIKINPLLKSDYHQTTIRSTYTHLRNDWRDSTQRIRQLEEDNNQELISSYGLWDEITPQVPRNEITLSCNPHYRYGTKKTNSELDSLLMIDTIKELISYSIGCMMGRYSIDQEGFVYAQCGNEDFDPTKYQAFSADDDGIIPIMDQDWFDDDATNRFMEFLKVAWSQETLDENPQICC